MSEYKQQAVEALDELAAAAQEAKSAVSSDNAFRQALTAIQLADKAGKALLKVGMVLGEGSD